MPQVFIEAQISYVVEFTRFLVDILLWFKPPLHTSDCVGVHVSVSLWESKTSLERVSVW